MAHQVFITGDNQMKWLVMKHLGWYHWQSTELAVAGGFVPSRYMAARPERAPFKVLAYAPSLDLNLTRDELGIAMLGLAVVSSEERE